MELFEGYTRTEDNKEAIESAENFTHNPNGLYIWGKTGCGKTKLAKCVKTFVDNTERSGVKTAFISTPELILKFKMCDKWVLNDFIDDYTHLLNYLFLDDLGAEKVTEETLDALFMIIDRWANRRSAKLFITSNLNPAELEEKTSDRIVSRIYEICKIVEIKGNTDYRLIKNKELK
jgi:DNA replication protein DnaC